MYITLNGSGSLIPNWIWTLKREREVLMCLSVDILPVLNVGIFYNSSDHLLNQNKLVIFTW